MFNLIKKRIQKLNAEIAQNKQLRVNTENENQAMSCGAFNPRLLARIKRSKADNTNKKQKTNSRK